MVLKERDRRWGEIGVNLCIYMYIFRKNELPKKGAYCAFQQTRISPQILFLVQHDIKNKNLIV